MSVGTPRPRQNPNPPTDLCTPDPASWGRVTRVIRCAPDIALRVRREGARHGISVPFEAMTAPVERSRETRRAFPPLVLTKTRPGVPRVGLVRRHEVISRLCEATDRIVTLVQAPAGYGKSTALMQWAKADPVRRFAWLTLEQPDNDPAVFWRYVLLALRGQTPGFADRAWRLLHRPQPDINAVIIHVLNDLLDLPGRYVLVLDDYHVITEPKCHASVQYFIDHLPKSMQIAFGTRSRPPLSVSRLEATGSLLVIDRGDLRFNPEETRKAVEAVGRTFSPETLRQIHERTEGWPVGVYLSAIAADVDSPSSILRSASAASAYVKEQMIADLSEADRSALTQWSILRHLNGSLCDRVANRRDSATRLAQLSEANLLLLPLDTSGTWYRFHDLLGDALRREFARRPAEQQRTAHRRAMQWWLQEDDPTQAIHHAIEAGIYEVAAELICSHWLEYMLNGWLESLREWINRFPQDAMASYPPILVASAWIMAFNGDVKATHRFAAAAREASFNGPLPDGSASYASSVAILRAGLGHDGMKDANANAEEAYRLEPAAAQARQLAAALAGLTRFALGRFEDGRVALQEAALTPSGEEGTAVYARGQLALLEMHLGNWEEGSRHADLACAQVEASDLGNLLSSGAPLAAAAAAAAHVGNRGLAEQRLRSLAPIQRVLSDAIPYDAFLVNLIAAETYLVLGDYRAAAVHAQTAASRLEAFGDAGIFEERHAELQKALAAAAAPDSAGAEPEPLTDRELQVLTLLQSDLSLRQIGAELFVSRNTAKSHVSSIYRKLGVTGRTAAIARARQHGLL